MADDQAWRFKNQDQIHIDSWHRMKQERERQGRLELALSIIRRWPKAFATICAEDANAAAIARHRGWHTAPTPKPTEAEIEAVSAAAAAAIAALSRKP